MTTDTLQSKLDDHKKQFLAKAPPEVIEVVKKKRDGTGDLAVFPQASRQRRSGARV